MGDCELDFVEEIVSELVCETLNESVLLGDDDRVSVEV